MLKRTRSPAENGVSASTRCGVHSTLSVRWFSVSWSSRRESPLSDAFERRRRQTVTPTNSPGAAVSAAAVAVPAGVGAGVATRYSGAFRGRGFDLDGSRLLRNALSHRRRVSSWASSGADDTRTLNAIASGGSTLATAGSHAKTLVRS